MNISLITEATRITRTNSLQCKVVRILNRNEVMTSDGTKKVTDAIIEDNTGEISCVVWHNNSLDKKVMLHDELLVIGGFGKKYNDKLKLVVNRYTILRRC